MKTILLLLLPAFLAGDDDIVHLKGGGKMNGTLRLDGDKAYLGIGGGEAELSLDQIARIEWGPDSPEPRKLRKIYRSKKGDPIELARWCTRFGLKREAKREWKRVLAKDPENEEALKALGKRKPRKRSTPKRKPAPRKSGPVVKSGPDPWDGIANGLTLRTEHFEIRGDIGKELLLKLAPIVEQMNRFHREHFGTDLGKEWKITLIEKQADFIAYSKKIGSTQYGGGGYCEWGLKEFVGQGESGHTWEVLIKHELGHAYYRSTGPFWLREGAATLVESLEWVKGRPVIQLNKIRLRQIKSYWKAGRHKNLRCCTLKPVFPLAYAHHWSFHYYVWVKKGKKFYRKMLKDLQNTKQKDDLTDPVLKLLGMTLDELERDWKAFVEGLK